MTKSSETGTAKKHTISIHDLSQLGAVNNVTTSSEMTSTPCSHIGLVHDSSLMGASQLSCISDIMQCDGADTTCDENSNHSVHTENEDYVASESSIYERSQSEHGSNTSEFDSEDEVDGDPEPAVLVPAPNQPPAGQPLILEVDPTGTAAIPSSLPLGIVANARSLYNKVDNFTRFLKEIGPDYFLVCETFEHEGRRVLLSQLLSHTSYKVMSYKRPRKANGKIQTGGGCAIVYNEARFQVEQMDFEADLGVETVFAIFTPKILDSVHQRVKRICVGSVYIPPRSSTKSETIDTIIQVIHYARSQYDNEINFTIAGDFNRTDHTDILESYGALHQCVTLGSRQATTDGAALTIILSDLHTLYHSPTTKPPLEVDENKKGTNSDHDMVIFAPKANPDFAVTRSRRTIRTRPIQDSKIPAFGRDIQSQTWLEVMDEPDVNLKAEHFHQIITSIRDKHFKQKTTTMTNLDKKWMTP